MGDYTNNQKFYLIDPTELVNVDSDVNYNLLRADERVKALVEYQGTDVPSIVGSTVPKEIGYKWYKRYSNSVYVHTTFNGVTATYQDVNSVVDTWSTAGISFEPGYGSGSGLTDRIGYKVSNNIVTWRGFVVLNNQATELPANLTTDFMTIPTSLQPIRNKYCTVTGGNSTAGSFQLFRVLFPALGSADSRLEFIKYGGNSSSSSERYISLNEISYSIDDT